MHARDSLIRTLLAALLATLLLAPAASAKGGGGPVIVHKLKPQANQITSADIRNAKPMPMPVLPAPSRAKGAGGARGGGGGNPRFIEGHQPSGLAVASAVGGAGATAAGFGTFTSRRVGDPTAYPNSTNGKVFAEIPGEGLFTCSASVVHGKNASTIFTAGHCVKEPRGSFVSALSFVPAYDRGSEPFGSWSAKAVGVKRAWARKGNRNYDYAAVALRRNELGRVEDVVGSQGFAFNVKPKKKDYRAVGYPINKFQTEVMWECLDRFARRDPTKKRKGPRPIGIGCDMVQGSSGGGWTLPGTYLNSVTSFGYKGLRNGLFGPYFDKAAEKLRKAAGRQ